MEYIETVDELRDLKRQIIRDYSFYDQNDEQMLVNLKDLIDLDTEQFEEFINEIVLRRYYASYLSKIAPWILELVRKNNYFILAPMYIKERDELLEENHKLLYEALNCYGLTIEGDCLESSITNRKFPISTQIVYANRKNMFEDDKEYDERIRATHKMIEYNYNPLTWECKINTIKLRLADIETVLHDNIPSFDSKIKDYENMINTYREFKMKYVTVKPKGASR